MANIPYKGLLKTYHSLTSQFHFFSFFPSFSVYKLAAICAGIGRIATVGCIVTTGGVSVGLVTGVKGRSTLLGLSRKLYITETLKEKA